MNSVMNEITNSDMEYQEIIRKSDIYSNKLEALQLPKETRLLIDRYVSEQNALGSRYGMLAYQLGFPTARNCLLRDCHSQIFRQRHQGTKYNPETENNIREKVSFLWNAT